MLSVMCHALNRFFFNFKGLCGNFNSKETDDFKTSGGLVEATASAFANTWKAQPTCQDIPDFLDDPCSLSIEKGNNLFHNRFISQRFFILLCHSSQQYKMYCHATNFVISSR